jgi:hypothetical protein
MDKPFIETIEEHTYAFIESKATAMELEAASERFKELATALAQAAFEIN